MKRTALHLDWISMKRANLTAFILLGFLLVMNVFSFININSRFISFLHSSLHQEVSICGEYMEEQLGSFESDLNGLLYDYNFADIFDDEETYTLSEKSIEIFYYKYRDLVKNVYIFDNKKNYFGLYINDNEVVIDTFPRQRQYPLVPRHKVEEKGGTYIYHYPYFADDKVSGNIIVEIDFESFARKIFAFYPKGKTITWQWVLNSDGEILSSDFPSGSQVSSLEIIADSIDMISSGLIKHMISDETYGESKVNSAYYPLSIFNKSLGIVFSVRQKEFNRFFIQQNMMISIISFLLSLALIFYLLYIIGHRARTQERLKMSEIVFRQIMENFPVGIVVLDAGDIIRHINGTAQKMLFNNIHENMVGKDFSTLITHSENYLLKDDTLSQDMSDYIFYEKDGVETVIYRIELETRIGGESLKLVALVDVSPLERSRRQEVAANRTKSDFLAAMSHEIRTPMNGILGMIALLMDSTGLKKEDRDRLTVIKKSSDLMMTIINDILDYSKIEAGKMLLEEIPFRVRTEITLIQDLFQPLAGEKGLTIDTQINTSVPDRLIGDPFRLRQVISNLVSNAVKFTEKGKIVIGADLLENVKGRIQVLFWVEDSGIGIPKEKVSGIFSGYNQSGSSIARKFGGTGLGTTIAKQLVELMNGEIWVESPSRNLGTKSTPGSRFSFTAEFYSNERMEKNFKYDSIFSLNKLTFLFLTRESSPERNKIYQVLTNFGINIVTKVYQDSNIDSVVHHLQSKSDFYHMIVITDKEGQDGFSLAQRIKDDGLMETIPAMFVSANDRPGNYKLARKLCIDYYLIEPFETKEIFDIINEVFPTLKDKAGIISTLNALPEELNILVVEDNVINQKVAQTIFKNIGYEIEVVSNGAEAIARTVQNSYDIIFMDLFMPEMDGFEAAAHIREKGVTTPIIAMSADVNDERKEKALKSGMDRYLAKPTRIETVKELLIQMFSIQIK